MSQSAVPNSRPSFKISSKGRPNFSLSVKSEKLVLVASNPADKYQHWVKFEYPDKRDSECFPSFAIVNKETLEAIRHAAAAGGISSSQSVELTTFDPFIVDEFVLWTQGQDLGSGFGSIRTQNNVSRSLEASGGDSVIVANSWTGADNQQWKIEQYVTYRMSCKLDPSYSVTMKSGPLDGIIFFAKADPYNEFQHWYKESSGVTDSQGFPGIILINKGTGQAIVDAVSGGFVAKYDPANKSNRSIQSAEVQTFPDDYKRLRYLSRSINQTTKLMSEPIVHGTNVYASSNWTGGTPAELWKFEPFIQPLPVQPTVKIYCKAGPNFSITIKCGAVVLAQANPADGYQHWFKHAIPHKPDSQGYSGFVLVNKITGQAIKNATGANQPVQLVTYNPNALNDSTLWTKARNADNQYSEIRVQSDVSLNLNVCGGTVKDNVPVINQAWFNGADNELWKIEQY